MSGFLSYDNKSPSEVRAGTLVHNPGTGETGTADGYGGVHKHR